MTAQVGYATMQIIPSVRGLSQEIRRQLAPVAAQGEATGQQTGRGFGEAFKSGLEAVGLLALAAKLGQGISQALGDAVDQAGVPGKLKAQLGATAADAGRYGDIAGRLYAGAVTDSVETAAAGIRAIVSSGLVPAGATNAQLESITTKVSDVATAFDQDLGGVASSVGQLIKTGLVKDATEGLDLVTRGFQSVGPNGADDLLDTVNEYAVQFQGLGLTGPKAMGVIVQAMQGGARNTDLAADALKEFRVRAVNLNDTNAQAGFKALGLNAADMAKKVAGGGPSASGALQTVIGRLRGIKDPAKQATVAGQLFGTQSEDMARALLKIDPSSAVKALGNVAGSADQMGTDLRDNAGARLTAFTRGLQQGLVTVIGGQVLPRLLALATTVQTKVGPPLTRIAAVLARNVGPAMDATGRFITGTLVPGLIASAGWVNRNRLALGIAAGVVTALLLPVLATLAVSYATTAAAAVVSGAEQVGMWIATSAGAVGSAALQVASSYRTVGGWIAQGAAATASGARVVGAWVTAGLAAAQGALAQGLAVVRVVAGWVLMGIQSLLQAGRMAAAWLIALGPIGWITAAVIGIVALVIANWSTISSWTVRIWKGIVSWVTGAVSAVVGWVRSHWPLLVGILTGPIGLAAVLIIRNWDRISGGFKAAYRAVVQVGATLVTWVGGLPGRITAGLGDLGRLLYSAGSDVVTGLWKGIESKGAWIASKLSAFVKDKIPGPVRKVLDIHSPSKVMAELGRYTGQGLVVGLTGTTPQVAAASKKLADLVRKAFTGTSGRTARTGQALARLVARDNAQLAALAKQRDTVADRLKAAQDKLAGLRKDAADLRGQIAGSITSAASITREMPAGTEVTAASILDRLRGDVKAASLFAAQLASLRKRGLSADLIGQIAQAGVEQGGATAAALAAATPAQIKAINAQQAALAKAASRAGTVAADAMYRSGIQAAQGLVDGLRKQESAIEAQMLRIAKSMQAAIRKALGIHSPSRVMAALGRFAGLGLIRGLDGQRGAVDGAMRRLVAVPAAPVLATGTGRSPGGRGGDLRPVQITMYGADRSFAEQRADLIRHMTPVA